MEPSQKHDEEVIDTVASLIVDNCSHTTLFCREGFFEQLKQRVALQISEHRSRKIAENSCSYGAASILINQFELKKETVES